MSILEEAAELINGDRASTYGDVTENFQRIADMWTAYKGVEVPFTAYDVSNMMILVKVARLATGGYHRDSVADIAGYAGLSEQINDKATAIVRPSLMEMYESTLSEVARVTPVVFEGLGDAFANWARSFLGLPSQPETSPRVWESLADVPTDVKVTDSDGDAYEFTDNGWYWSDVNRWLDSAEVGLSSAFAPFTEVLEPKKPEPRVVDKLTRELVEDGTVWKDEDGDSIKFFNEVLWRKFGDDDDAAWEELSDEVPVDVDYLNEYAPYTEVLEPA